MVSAARRRLWLAPLRTAYSSAQSRAVRALRARRTRPSACGGCTTLTAATSSTWPIPRGCRARVTTRACPRGGTGAWPWSGSLFSPLKVLVWTNHFCAAAQRRPWAWCGSCCFTTSGPFLDRGSFAGAPAGRFGPLAGRLGGRLAGQLGGPEWPRPPEKRQLQLPNLIKSTKRPGMTPPPRLPTPGPASAACTCQRRRRWRRPRSCRRRRSQLSDLGPGSGVT